MKYPDKKEMVGNEIELSFQSGWNACRKEFMRLNECEHLYEDTKKTDAGRRIGKCVKCGFILVGLLDSDFVVPQNDISVHGVYIEKDGKRIDPKDFYKPVSVNVN